MRYRYIGLLIFVCFLGCAGREYPFINRNGTYVLQGEPSSDWVAQGVEGSASFKRIVARRSSVPRRYRVGSPPAWSPGWFIDYDSEDYAVVAVGEDADENFWSRCDTL